MVRYLLIGVCSLVLGVSMTSFYYSTQTTVQVITAGCEEPATVPAPTGTGEIDTTYVPQGRRLNMPGSQGGQ